MLPHVPVHIVQRGNNRSPCFFRDGDYALYLFHLEKLAAQFDCAVHAWCLMTNHVHLLMTPDDADSCALLMKHLGQRYVQYVNRSRQRTGTLWEGRFRSCLAQSENYVLACYRYIELNPVRAHIVSHPRDYRWSSYRANAEGAPSDLRKPHPEYAGLAAVPEPAYCALFADQLAMDVVGEIRAATNGGFVLGGDSFKQQVGRALGRRVSRGSPGRPSKALA